MTLGTDIPYCNEHQDIRKDLSELRDEIKDRDKGILRAFNDIKKQVGVLRKDMDDKQIINNYNARERQLLREMDEKERQILRERIDEVGGHAEDADVNIYQQIADLKRFIMQLLLSLFGLFGVLIAILTYFRI